jgi:hypothetical protein
VPVKAAREALAGERRTDHASASWTSIDFQSAVSERPENPLPNASIEFSEATSKSLANFDIGLLPIGEDALRPMRSWIEKSFLSASPQVATFFLEFGHVPRPICLQVSAHGFAIVVFVHNGAVLTGLMVGDDEACEYR